MGSNIGLSVKHKQGNWREPYEFPNFSTCLILAPQVSRAADDDGDGLGFSAAVKSRVRNPVDQQRWGFRNFLNFDSSIKNALLERPLTGALWQHRCAFVPLSMREPASTRSPVAGSAQYFCAAATGPIRTKKNAITEAIRVAIITYDLPCSFHAV